MEKLPKFDYRYDSRVSSIKKITQEEVWTLKREKNIARAMKYAEGTTATTLNNFLHEFEKQLQDKVKQAEAEEKTAKEKKEKEYDAYLAKIQKVVTAVKEKASVQRENDYLSYCKQMDAVNTEVEFFSRISLEDKLGVEYEPYIFAALNSAKVMLVVGTDYEYFDAVWVKNEWSRFLKLIAGGQKKVLIPVFKNMDPYDMPKEFSKLAAQDMGKVGAMQDLLRGVEKLLGGKQEKEHTGSQNAQTFNVASANPTVTSLLERAFMFADDFEFEKANEYAEKVLDIEPKNAEAYVCKLMCSVEVTNREFLGTYYEPFDKNSAYLKILQYGTDELIKEIKGYNSEIKERIRKKEEEERKAKEAAAEAERKAAEQKKQEIASLKKKIADLENQKAHPEQQLTGKDREKADQLLADIKTAENQAKQQKAPLENAGKKLKDLENKLTQEYAYRSSLGLFKGNEKKAAQQRIDSLERERNEAAASVQALEEEARKAEGRVNKAKENYNTFSKQVLSSKSSEIDGQIQKTAVKLMVLEGEGQFGYYQGQWIDWLVLAREDDKALLISKYGLDCQQYHTSWTSITWEKCTLRTWLNNTFLNTAFSMEEQKQIVTSTVKADKNPEHDANPGNDTKDKVLSSGSSSWT